MDYSKKFEEVFGMQYERKFFTPGRINLIGEHIDYSGGCVFPCAITFGTYGWISLRDDQKLCLYSENFPNVGIVEVDLNNIIYDEKDEWTNYPKGVVKMMQDAGLKTSQGMNVFFYGDIPNGAGLSSSASLEVLTGLIVSTVNSLDIEMIDIVKFAQKAENNFVGVNCGIMDQFAVGMGKKHEAMLLNTNTLSYEYIPVVLEGYAIVIMNTNKRRGLVDSAYNERRQQCESALSILNTIVRKEFLCDHDLETLQSNRHLFHDDVIYKRALHAITEHSRTLEAAKVLKNNDLLTFGKLLNESHVSLRDDYEVTGKELDTMVEAAWVQTGVLGARITGAGFGGCAFAIVDTSFVDDFIQNASAIYLSKIGYEGSFYVATVGQGAHER